MKKILIALAFLALYSPVSMSGYIQPRPSNFITYNSGSGTYYPTAGAHSIKVTIVGSGGGGVGSGSDSSGTAPTAGATTTFGTSFISAGGGGIGTRTQGSAGGVGGTYSAGSATVIAAANGGPGDGAIYMAPTLLLETATSNLNQLLGGRGGGRGGGAGGPYGGFSTTQNAVTNSGGGGGGGGLNAYDNIITGPGGGEGAYLKILINNPSAAGYAYSVAAAGSAGTAGSNGSNGGSAAAGKITIEEIF